jgi:hypothetical protein
MIRVVAVDPGKITGVAVGVFGTERHVEAHELAPMDAVGMVDGLLSQGVAAVACESFTPRPGARTWQPDALDVIGALRWVCHVHNTRLLQQSPADAKSFSTNEKLARLGWRRPTKGGHADDALRHLLLFAIRGDLIDPEELL